MKMLDSIVSQHSPGDSEDNSSEPKLDNKVKLPRTGRKNGGNMEIGFLRGD
jgi:hypothetical protein